MTTICAGSATQVSQAAVRIGKSNSKGQVLGLWWTEKMVLNENLNTLSPRSTSEISEMNLVTKIRYSMLSLKGDFMDPTGSSVRYDLIKKSPKFEEYLVLVRQLSNILRGI